MSLTDTASNPSTLFAASLAETDPDVARASAWNSAVNETKSS